MNCLMPIAFACCLMACKEISFREPQPMGKRALREVPKELRGRYLIDPYDENANDTLVVTAQGYFVTNDSTRSFLSDSLVLKKYSGYYFFNAFEKSVWLLRIVKRESNGNLTYMAMDSGEKTFHSFLMDLNKEIRIDSMEVEGSMVYQIDPSPKELLYLVKKGYFSKAILLRKFSN